MEKIENKFEQKFQGFCGNRGWRVSKISEIENNPTPDFLIIVNKNAFIAEVKTLSKSGLNDRKDIKSIEINGKVVGQSGDYNKEIDSIVKKLNKANKQFKTTAFLNIPQVVFIYSEREFISLDEKILSKAMYGKVFQRLAIINEEKSKELAPLILDRTLRQEQNNLISAVVIKNSKNGMSVIHNLWAKEMFPYDIFNNENDKNYIPHEIKFKVV